MSLAFFGPAAVGVAPGRRALVLRRSARVFVCALLACAVQVGGGPLPLSLSSNDVLALLGGEDMVAWQANGYFETLLTARLGAEAPRFRYLAQEGDTVFEQPRQLNFPRWPEQLERVGATVLVCQFGQSESLRGRAAVGDFAAAYEVLLDQFAGRPARIVLLSPTPFERVGGDLPDLADRNVDLAAYVEAVRQVARRRGGWFVDLFTPLRAAASAGTRLTRDGLHLDTTGQWLAAHAAASQLGLAPDAVKPAAAVTGGRFTTASLEELRQLVLAKNRLWFDYWRPHNWAFLAGDRTDQPSSRDHRDPSVRWFPREMEEFLPLIAGKESRIRRMAAGLAAE